MAMSFSACPCLYSGCSDLLQTEWLVQSLSLVNTVMSLSS